MSIVVKYIILAAILSCTIFFPVFLYQAFQLKTLIIITNQSKLNGLTILNGQNLLVIDDKKITDYLQKQNPEVKSMSIGKIIPRTIILSVQERIPVAQIVNNIGSIYVDKDGIILRSEKKYPGLPQINIADVSIYSNQKMDWRIIKVLFFIDEARKQGIIIEQISVNDTSGGFSARISTGTQILLPYDADIPIKASSLQVIIHRFTIVGKNITKVDFRFDKPLVTLSNGEKISSTLPAQAGF